jgi:hypothetical protein
MAEPVAMVDIVSLDALLAADVPVDVAEIPGVGLVKVRGLTRAELHLLTKKDGGNPSAETSDVFYFTHGLVEPAVTESQARKVFESIGFGALQPVIAKISELSGVSRDDQKAAYKSLRD